MCMHQLGRRRPIRRKKAYGYWYGYGKQVTDQVSGDDIPLRLAVPQRGGMVYREWSNNTRDRDKEY